MIELSRTSERIRSQPMFQFMAMAKSLEDEGRKVIHLEIGDTSSFSNQHLLRILRDLAENPPVGYAPSAGDDELRTILAEHYGQTLGTSLTKSNVVISPANALISQVFMALGDPGDRVLIPDPGFSTYPLALDALGQEGVYYPLHESEDWNPDLDEITALLGHAKTPKAVVINSPSNPLGSVMKAEIIDAIISEAARRNVAVIIDETYKNLVFNGAPVKPVASYENVMFLYSFSKDCAVPGMRIGSLVGPEHVVAKISDHNSLFYSCQPPLFQKTIARYMRENGAFDREMIAEIAVRAQAVGEILSQSNRLSFVPPRAAFYVFVDVSKIGRDGETVARDLLHETGVCVCPGGYFGPSGKGHIRLSLSGDKQELLDGCRRIVEFANDR